MPNFDDDPKFPAKRLLLVGIPLFVLAVILSVFIHQFSHLAAHRILAARGAEPGSPQVSPLETLAGPASTFLVALGSLALFVRYPRNLFFPSLAFVNATSRLPEAVTLCVQLFFRRALNPASEEGSLLALLHLHNSTAGLAILCFFSLTLIFMSIAVVHESRWVPWKWPVALAMFGLLIPLQPLLVRVIAPAFS